mmetsp:Transcript_48412/g.122096  ORF Transcript_48412/g.122096 Transcript_48412/m.122096 type:complete len:437 (-) Transcript_48412:98-1408(-)|eukprot:CAMPEP_0115629564 /NCGR_PEP_ID=MMETSP0272-20121206/30013_1 /TAXON_ID=71861 /ORGANISM="Scrippsiella trochoidea, Strain CCMP3099" /LENGTH=436 /DNA_ID=CAMNT_0003066131 /DNA_START=62 /DNA_END=1372 /DNA_ORIENTATION=+
MALATQQPCFLVGAALGRLAGPSQRQALLSAGHRTGLRSYVGGMAQPGQRSGVAGSVLGQHGLFLGPAALVAFASCRRAGRRTIERRAVAVDVAPAATDAAPRQLPRPAHWVIRTTDLKKSVDFLTQVFGMSVLRHEEQNAGCKITCNGAISKPWSKTMIGYRREDEGYCLEITYTYTVDSYTPGTGLAYIAIGVDDVKSALEAAADLGYTVDGDMITGPEQYKYRVVPQPAGREERFQYVALNVRGMAKAEEFYKNALGMSDLTADSPHASSQDGDVVRVVGYGDSDEVPLVLREDPKSPFFKLQIWEGRNALSIPSQALNVAYRKVVDEKPGGSRVLHKLQTEPLQPGKVKRNTDLKDLEIAIVVAPEGFEVCIVSSETFDIAVADAYNPGVEIDWSWREQKTIDVIRETAELEAQQAAEAAAAAAAEAEGVKE